MKQISYLMQRWVALSVLISLPAAAQVNVLTYHNDNGRTGANLNETVLTPDNVNLNSFGKLFTYDVDGYVYAQPLYVSGLNMAGQGVHNVVFVATEHNSVYAFDADSNTGANGGLLWQVNLGPSAQVPSPELPFNAIKPEVGITGTPVIDAASQTLYVDAFTEEGTNFIHRVHALSLVDGSEKPFSPVVVAASVHGVGAGSAKGILPFQAVQQLQRSALTLAGGVLYVCFAGFTDTPNTDPYHGWVLGFNPANLQLLPNYVFASTPNGTTAQFGSIAGRGGIWMGGGGMAVDGNNNLYFATGDGNFTAFPGSGGTDYGDSYLKLSTAGGLAVADYFTPNNEAYQQVNDLDTGSGGVLLLPDQPGPYPHLLIGGGKPQRAFVMNRDMLTTNNMHIDTNGMEDPIVQTMPLGGGSFDTPAYFNEAIYYVATKDTIRRYALSNGTLIPDLPNSFGTRKFAFPGATPSISANGDADGIVWTIQNAQPAVLVAYNATNLSTELYNSSQAPGQRDQLTGGVKFVVPTVANGKVYAGSQGALSVFGLLDNGTSGSWTPITASYSGLFSESSGTEFGKSGMVNIQTSKRGSFSGKLELGGKSYSFRGTFDPNGAGSSAISQKTIGVINVGLQVDTNDNNTINGLVSGDTWAANLTAYRNVFNKRSNPAPFAGKYSLTFAGPGDNDPSRPQNDGSGTATVSTAGQVKFKGVLGDGTRVSQSAILSPDGSWPFYVPLYKQGGQIMGWLNFDSSSVSGQPSWIKLPNDRNKSFPGGFELNPAVTGSAQ
ncbi:MAG TPA: hypothetical protein VG938_06130 [Verrucomicrobiae bacterium]|jgi:hypothetical protein|nr:hypothetical protein [Verrucomicrobiae bacterium]